MREKDMTEHVKWTIIVMLTFIIILIYVGVKETGRANRGEAYRKQLIAFCGAVSEARLELIGEVFAHSEKFRKGVISFSTVEDQKDFVFTRRYSISPNGDITIYKDNSRGEQIIKKTWKDYPRFYSIGEK